MMKLIKSLILSLVFIVGFQSTASARDITLSMWTHNQLYVDYYNSFLEDIMSDIRLLNGGCLFFFLNSSSQS